MIQQLVHVIIVSIFCIVWGLPLLIFFRRLIVRDNFWFVDKASKMSFAFFLGCISLSVISSWSIFFLPLKFEYLLITTPIPAGIVLIFQRKELALTNKTPTPEKNPSLIQLVFAIVSIGMFICLGSLKPVNGDTQIYHLQIIQWQRTYGIVPGLANLFPRLGLSSNWFNLISLFHLPGVENQSCSYVNTAFVTWFFIWLLSKFRHFSVKEKSDRSSMLRVYYFLLIIFMFADWQLFRDAANSTNYDFVVIAFYIITLSFLIEKLFETDSKGSLIIVTFAIATIAFKFSGIFIFLALIYHLRKNSFPSKLRMLGITSLIVIIPVLIKNYLITGYLLYPFPFRFNSPDWQLPYDLTKGIYNYILNAGRFYNAWKMIGKTDASLFSWLPYWFNTILLQHKAILFLALSSTFFFFYKPSLINNHKSLQYMVATLIAMITGWFISAPDPARFGYGILLPASFLLLSLVMHKKVPAFIYILLLYCLSGLMIIYSSVRFTSIWSGEYALHPQLTEKPVYNIVEVNNLRLNLPEIQANNWDHRCYDTPLPCLCRLNPYLKKRGDEISNGFKMKPYPDSTFIKNYEY